MWKLALLQAVAIGSLALAGTEAFAGQGDPDRQLLRVWEKVDESGKDKQRVRVEEYAAAPITVPVHTLTIAQMYKAADGRSGEVAAAEVAYRCMINDAGRILANFCEVSDRAVPLDPVIDGLIRVSLALYSVPDFPAITQPRKGRIDRYVTLTVRVPAVQIPALDLASGLLVERKDLPLLDDPSRLKLDYPPRALRQAVQGRSLVECQVQADLSVICQQMGFEPPEHGALFASNAARVFGDRAFPELKLADGSDARGVRFRVRLTWTLN
jgi:hypothetical protein